MVETQVEEIAVEEEEPVKKLKTSLSLSKKKSIVTHNNATDNDSIKQREEESLCKQKGPEKVTKVKLTSLGKSIQQKSTSQELDCIEALEVHNENPTKNITLGKSRMTELNVENNEAKTLDLPGHIRKSQNKIDTFERVTKNTSEKEPIKEDTLDHVTLERETIENIRSKKDIMEGEIIEKEPMDIHLPILPDKNNEPTCRKRPLDASFFSQNVIELSDTDDDLFNKPVFHSLQLSKKQKRNKLSLSKKRRS